MIIKENKNRIVIYAVFLILTVLVAICKIFIGIDVDEEYTTWLTCLLGVEKPVLDVWDVYQSSAILSVPFVRLYTLMSAGSLDGLIVFLRCLSVFVQWAIAFFAYVVLKKIYGSDTAFFSAIVGANMLPRAVQNFEYGFLTTELIFLALILLLDVWKTEKTQFLKIFVAGVAYGLAVFSYPTMVITLPIVAYIVLKKVSDDIRVGILYSTEFWGSCLLLLVLVIAYLLSYMTITDLLINIRGITTSDDHSGLFLFLKNPKTIMKSLVRCIGLASVPVGIFLILKKRLNVISIPYIYMVEMSVILIGLNITGVRNSGPFGLLERYIVLVLFSVIFIINTKEYSEIKWLFCVVGVFIYAGAMAATNLGLNENAMYLELSIIGCVILACENIKRFNEKRNKAWGVVCLLFLCFEIVFSKGYFVRIDGTGPANVFEKRVRSDISVCKGIWNYALKEENNKDRKDCIANYTAGNITYAYIGKNPLCNYFFCGMLIAPQYAATLSTGQQWVDYYEREGIELPDQIYIDKEKHSSMDDFFNTKFGSYIKDKYNFKQEQYFYIGNK